MPLENLILDLGLSLKWAIYGPWLNLIWFPYLFLKHDIIYAWYYENAKKILKIFIESISKSHKMETLFHKDKQLCFSLQKEVQQFAEKEHGLGIYS